MDDKLQNDFDDDNEIPDNPEDRGPLGRLLEHSISSSTPESEGGTQTLNKPSQPRTGSTDYAKGTREHDDDREG